MARSCHLVLSESMAHSIRMVLLGRYGSLGTFLEQGSLALSGTLKFFGSLSLDGTLLVQGSLALGGTLDCRWFTLP